MRYKTGIIGLGRIGTLFDDDPKRKHIWTHAKAYLSIPEVDLVAAVDPDGNKREMFKKRCNIENVYPSSKEMFKAHRLDIVSICCPTKYHYSEGMEAVKNNVKAIFMEKPITEEICQARELIMQCEKKGIILAVNHIRRWDDNYLYAKKLLDEGEIGKIKSIVGYYSHQLIMSGTHLIDLMRYYGGEIDAVIGDIANYDDNDPTVSGYLKYRNGIKGFIVPQGGEKTLIFEIDIVGSKGRIRVIDNGEKMEFYKFQESKNYSGYEELRKQKNSHSGLYKERFIRAIEDILICIREKKKPLCSGYDGLKAIEIANAMIVSSNNCCRFIDLTKEDFLNA